jgi:nucleoside-diphosphate-sugar epimerase
MSKKILVTGAAGFIGSNLVRELIKQGYEVTGIDNLSAGREEKLRDCRDNFLFLKGDIRNPCFCEEVTEGKDAVLHHAAISSVPKSFEDPLFVYENNVAGTLNLLEASKTNSVGKFIFASSASVYKSCEEKQKEDMITCPSSPYAMSKYIGEEYCKFYFRENNLNTIIFRYFNVFGPGQSLNSSYAAVVPSFIEDILNKTPPIIYGDGSQKRDFTYVDNIVNANIIGIEAGQELCGDVYNIGTGKSISLNELLMNIIDVFRFPIHPEYTPARIGDVQWSEADISKAEKKLGYKSIDVLDGLKKFHRILEE